MMGAVWNLPAKSQSGPFPNKLGWIACARYCRQIPGLGSYIRGEIH